MNNLDTKSLGKWLFLIGVVVAGVMPLLNIQQPLDWLPVLLVVFAIVAGIFYADYDDLTGIVIRFLGLTITADAFYGVLKISDNPTTYIGDYVSDFANGVVGFLAAYVLTVVLFSFWKKHFSS